MCVQNFFLPEASSCRLLNVKIYTEGYVYIMRVISCAVHC